MDVKEGIPIIGGLLEKLDQIKHRREDRRIEVRRKLQPYVAAVRAVVGGRWPLSPDKMLSWAPVLHDVQSAREAAVNELNLSRSIGGEARCRKVEELLNAGWPTVTHVAAFNTSAVDPSKVEDAFAKMFDMGEDFEAKYKAVL